ncbi:MAG: hypothetical protein FWG02_02760 [Holophagaceae bacterium]|nr:hypothetical protein [Holophagaceae bacterium]
MPLYEYCCSDCNASEERLCSYSSPEEYDCPTCGKPAGMVRKLSVPSINFSGGRWYAQGYSDSPPCKAEKPSAEGSSKPSTQTAGSEGCCANCPAMNK